MSSDLEWELLKKTNCFLLKNNGLALTKEPFNISSVNQQLYCGLTKGTAFDIHRKGDSLILTVKKKGDFKVKDMFRTYDIKIKKKSKKVPMKKVGHLLKNMHLHPAIMKRALQRASNLLRDHTVPKTFHNKQEQKEYIINK